MAICYQSYALWCQCPLGLLPHFYAILAKDTSGTICVNALSGCYLISTRTINNCIERRKNGVNALSGCYLISTKGGREVPARHSSCVNALSGCYLISTTNPNGKYVILEITVSMPSRAVTSFLLKSNMEVDLRVHRVNALSGCYLISTGN